MYRSKINTILIAALTAASMLCSCGSVDDTNGSAGSDNTEKPSASTSAEIKTEPTESSASEETTTSAEKSSPEAETENSSDKSKPGLLQRLFGRKKTASGRDAYRESNAYDDDVIIDGFNYRYEVDRTDTFIAFNKDGEAWLFDPSRPYYSGIDPEGLCEVEPGKAYTLTYDIQYVTGGIAGVHEMYLLDVESCEPAEISSFFKPGGAAYGGLFNARQISSESAGDIYYVSSGQKGNQFICVNTGDGYTLYKEDGSVLHFDDVRQVAVPYNTVEETRKEFKLPIGFRVLCQKSVTDEQIISGITSGRLSENKDIFLLGSCSESGICADAPECAGVKENTVPLFESESPDPEDGFRKVITMADFERGITAEEVGVPEDVFYIAQTQWISDRDYYGRYSDGKERYPYSRGILILGGSFLDSDMLFMDNDARFCVANRENIIGTRSTDKHMNYAIISVRQEYLDLIPQE